MRSVLTKTIPGHRVAAYINMGWHNALDVTKVEFDHSGFYQLFKVMDTADEKFDMTIHSAKPKSIQTGVIKRPLGLYENSPVSEAVVLGLRDCNEVYDMTSSSLRRMQAQFNLYQLSKIDSITRIQSTHRFVLRMYANFDSVEERTQYLSWAQQFIEATPNKKVDFWWDTQNDVLMSFDKNFMGHLEGVLKASFRYLDSITF